jgi:hypothetical protein
MPFVMSKFLEHGTSNPIVARLSLQTMRILDQCKIAQETRDKITEIYVCSLQKKLIRCWEIEERFRSEFKSAVECTSRRRVAVNSSNFRRSHGSMRSVTTSSTR